MSVSLSAAGAFRPQDASVNSGALAVPDASTDAMLHGPGFVTGVLVAILFSMPVWLGLGWLFLG